MKRDLLMTTEQLLKRLSKVKSRKLTPNVGLNAVYSFPANIGSTEATVGCVKKFLTQTDSRVSTQVK
ncbi:hypothetical protein GRS66_006500 [Saccharomyces pastorianus]|uniref:Uncharacterized protein n=1 Tax=Saccharomyces pastorianus TaxID=27292 RepID=A0A6C1E500_SACPS|nr:hypothetical protein GRS66_006500 [Saccharomyces pastorianus]